MAPALPWRYALPNLLLLGGIAAVIAGGVFVWAMLAVTAIVGVAIDEAVGDERKALSPAARAWFTANLALTLPLLILYTIAMLHLFTDGDPIGLKAALAGIGIPFGHVGPEIPLWVTAIAVVFLTGEFYSAGGVSVGHELIHWTHNRLAMIAGRALMSFTFDSAYSIGHLFGHHRAVGTWQDPSTARRGESVYGFFVRTTIGQIAEGFTIEADRLRRRGHGVWSWRNRAIRGQLYTLALLVLAGFIAGAAGILIFVLGALFGRFSHQVVTYYQHYGLVRAEGTPIAPRHSWDSARVVSNAMTYNMPHHAQHHVAGSRRGWELTACGEQAPNLPKGYRSMFYIALVPFRFRHWVHPLLADWDRNLATDRERELIRGRGWEIAKT